MRQPSCENEAGYKTTTLLNGGGQIVEFHRPITTAVSENLPNCIFWLARCTQNQLKCWIKIRFFSIVRLVSLIDDMLRLSTLRCLE